MSKRLHVTVAVLEAAELTKQFTMEEDDSEDSISEALQYIDKSKTEINRTEKFWQTHLPSLLLRSAALCNSASYLSLILVSRVQPNQRKRQGHVVRNTF